MGIPTTEKRPGEIYHPDAKYASTPFAANEYRIQWHRFDPDCDVHPLVRTVPHVAFKVDDLDREIAGKAVILGPHNPLPNYRTAMIEQDGAVIEFIETTLTDEEIAACQVDHRQPPPQTG